MDMAASSSSSPTDEPPQHHDLQQQQQHPPPPLKEFLHKTKLIQFLGRTTPIILQNDNGPCPLLAICNVLLLRNQLSLGSDITEVSQEKLLSLVAERLIDSNSNVNNKDAGYVENQLQNIADAIDLLPRLATGIDVNLKFTGIQDFEFTPECAIFDLLDIPLCHGWLVDPQDHDTATAIGSKSYNALMEKLVSLETRNIEIPPKNNPEEDCVDFVAATTAALGVPSPSLSKARSFDDSPHSVSDQAPRKGDLEEEEELLRALKLSEIDSKASISDPFVGHANDNGGEVSFGMDENTCNKQAVTVDSGVDLGKSTGKESNDFHESETAIPDDCTVSSKHYNEHISSTSTVGEAANSSLKNHAVSDFHQSPSIEPKESIERNEVVEKQNLDASVQIESAVTLSPEKYSVSISESCADGTRGDEKVHNQSSLTTIDHEVSDESQGPDATGVSCLSASHTNSDSSSIRFPQTGASGAFPSAVDGSEPIYEGEECVLDPRTENIEDREPVYEGEAVLQEQADKSTLAKEEMTPEQGELVKSFLMNNASQLTICGLFSLQAGLKERELRVFFRNNHFSTMFKFEGALYLLATDQGYINQPDLVWESLNEVNGDTLFMTGNFKEFKVESQENNTWDENNAMTSTADYLASIESAAQAGLGDVIDRDLQMAITMQQEEFEQQPPRNNQQPQSNSGSSRLVTGPQVARSSGRNPSSSPRPDKSKEKCIVM
ncbi:ubiquitin carboxyl-terminal hydrolase MINDY-2 [Trifolium repens]|nr:ubiquitin carboxyl-terminal hydrolase MINDY-2 [Trifolium repens]